MNAAMLCSTLLAEQLLVALVHQTYVLHVSIVLTAHDVQATSRLRGHATTDQPKQLCEKSLLVFYTIK